jgi:hypothetical protein
MREGSPAAGCNFRHEYVSLCPSAFPLFFF